MLLDDERAKKTIQDVVAHVEDREPPVIYEDAAAKEIVQAMIRFGRSYLLYVVDDGGKLLGTITLGALVRHVFSRSHEPRIHARRLMTSITSENARHMMQKHPVAASKKEEIKDVLERMIRANVEEIAIIDDEKRVVGDITLLDLLEFILIQEKH